MASDRVVVELQIPADSTQRASMGKEFVHGLAPFANTGDDAARTAVDVLGSVRGQRWLRFGRGGPVSANADRPHLQCPGTVFSTATVRGVPQIPGVRDLDGLRCRRACGLGVGGTTVLADDRHLRMVGKPAGSGADSLPGSTSIGRRASRSTSNVTYVCPRSSANRSDGQIAPYLAGGRRHLRPGPLRACRVAGCERGVTGHSGRRA